MRNKSIKLASIIMAAIMMIAVVFAEDLSVSAANIDYSAVFDATYYAAKYPDLAAAGITSPAALLNHFVGSGMKEGRQGNAEFNVHAYRARYADLNNAFGDNLPAYYLHYISTGKAEGRVATGTAQTAAPATASTQPAAQPAATQAPAQNQVISLVNRDRANNGLGPVTATPELMAAAQKRAEEIVSTFSHTRPDGRSCFTVLSECGVSYSSCGENIAAGQNTPEAVETAWMNSPGHRANILRSGYGHIGVGYVTIPGGYGTYWVEIFTN